MLLGFASYRRADTGAIVVQALCEVFEEHAYDTSLTQLLFLVQQKLENEVICLKDNDNNRIYAGIAPNSGVNTLKHELYFRPEIPFKDWIKKTKQHAKIQQETRNIGKYR